MAAGHALQRMAHWSLSRGAACGPGRGRTGRGRGCRSRRSGWSRSRTRQSAARSGGSFAIANLHRGRPCPRKACSGSLPPARAACLPDRRSPTARRDNDRPAPGRRGWPAAPRRCVAGPALAPGAALAWPGWSDTPARIPRRWRPRSSPPRRRSGRRGTPAPRRDPPRLRRARAGSSFRCPAGRSRSGAGSSLRCTRAEPLRAARTPSFARSTTPRARRR